MNEKIFLPKKIKVGFNTRSDTYTGKLGYVIYHDGKVWRKEKSWESWRENYISPEELEDKKRTEFKQRIENAIRSHEHIKLNCSKNPSNYAEYYKKYAIMSSDEYLKEQNLDNYDEFDYRHRNLSSDEGVKPVEFENEPTEGFVLNKKVGGTRYEWNPRQTYTRVYDPRGFEFEITIPNLLYILENTNSIKGKGLEGKFIYGWSGTELVLIPEAAPEYSKMQKFTELQDKKVSKKDLVLGGIYLNARNENVVFLKEDYSFDYQGRKSDNKSLWFYSESNYNKTFTAAIGTIKEYSGNTTDNYSDLLDALDKNIYYKPLKEVIYTYEEANKWYIEKYMNGKSYDNQLFIKNKKSYKRINIFKQYEKSNGGWSGKYLYTTDGIDQFENLEDLMKKHKFYKELKDGKEK